MALKLVEAGIPKERLGLIAIPLIPLQLALPLIIAKYTTGKQMFKLKLFYFETPDIFVEQCQKLPILYNFLILG